MRPHTEGARDRDEILAWIRSPRCGAQCVTKLARGIVCDQMHQVVPVADPLVKRRRTHANRRRDALHGDLVQPVSFEQPTRRRNDLVGRRPSWSWQENPPIGTKAIDISHDG